MDCLNCCNMGCGYRLVADQDDVARDKRFIFTDGDVFCLKYQPDGGTVQEIMIQIDEIISETLMDRLINGKQMSYEDFLK